MWNSLLIGGRDVSVFQPPRPARFPVIFLTDWDDQSPQDHTEWETVLADHQIQLYVCSTGDTWWTNRPLKGWQADHSPADWLIQKVLQTIREQFSTVPIAITGIGAGGAAALRFGFQNPREFRAIGAIEATVDLHEIYGRGTSLDTIYPSKEHVRQDSPVLHLRGYDIPPIVWFGCSPDSFWKRGNERLQEKMAALGLPHHVDFNSIVCGHSWAFYDILAPRMLRMIAEGLTVESRKLL